MRPVRTNGQVLPSPKDSHTDEENICLVYSVPCSNYKYLYIGQTKQDHKFRLAKHKRGIRYQRSEQSALCEHVCS